MSLHASRQRALDRIEHTLVAEDPGLGLRFAVFTRLTRDDAMPGTEQVQGRLQRPFNQARPDAHTLIGFARRTWQFSGSALAVDTRGISGRPAASASAAVAQSPGTYPESTRTARL